MKINFNMFKNWFYFELYATDTLQSVEIIEFDLIVGCYVGQGAYHSISANVAVCKVEEWNIGVGGRCHADDGGEIG